MLQLFRSSSAVFSGGAGGARAPPEFGGSQKGQSLISAYQSLAIIKNTPGFEKLNTALPSKISSDTDTKAGILICCCFRSTLDNLVQSLKRNS